MAGLAQQAATTDVIHPPDQGMRPDQGKLLLTAGFNDVDGAAGGGPVPWAVITGYSTNTSLTARRTAFPASPSA